MCIEYKTKFLFPYTGFVDIHFSNASIYLESNYFCKFGKRLGFNIIECRVIDDNAIAAKDFTNNNALNFEPMQSILQ